MDTFEPQADDNRSSACSQTVERLQALLDGHLPLTALHGEIDAETHASGCATCRDRIAATKLLLSILTPPVDTRPINPVLTHQIVAAVLADRSAQRASTRSPIFRYVRRGGWFFAAILLAAFTLGLWSRNHVNQPIPTRDWPDQSSTPPTYPQSDPPRSMPETPSIRLEEQYSRAEVALRDSSKPITDSASAAPQIIVKLAQALSSSAEPEPEMPHDLEHGRLALSELPEAARSGLQPIAATTQKALARLMRDVGLEPRSRKQD
jgi:hypothetical protein